MTISHEIIWRLLYHEKSDYLGVLKCDDKKDCNGLPCQKSSLYVKSLIRKHISVHPMHKWLHMQFEIKFACAIIFVHYVYYSQIYFLTLWDIMCIIFVIS